MNDHKQLGALVSAQISGLGEAALTTAVAAASTRRNWDLFFTSARLRESDPMGAVVLVCAGKMSDGDVRRLMEFVDAWNQDVNAGAQETVVRHEDNLGPE